MTTLLLDLAVILVSIAVIVTSRHTRRVGDGNLLLRREMARLSKHPSTYHEQPLPYMRRYADDED